MEDAIIRKVTGELLKALRAESKLSQDAVTEKVHEAEGILWDRSELSRLENGKIALTPKMQFRLCSVYGITVEAFDTRLQERLRNGLPVGAATQKETEAANPLVSLKTLVFTDVAGSTKATADHGDVFTEYIKRSFTLLQEIAEWYAGEVVKTTGDGLFIAFDEAEQAMLFALTAQREMPKQSWQEEIPVLIRIRIAMRTGRVRYSPEWNDYFGHVANEAARICAVTPPERIYMCNATRDDAWANRIGNYALAELGVHRTKEGILLYLFEAGEEGFTPSMPVETTQTAQKSLARVANVPYDRNPHFVGREDILRELRKALETGTPTALTQALHGLGGIGKTQTAVEYFYRYGEAYHTVLWCRADTSGALAIGFRDIAQTLELPEAQATEGEIIVRAVQNWLGNPQNTGYLLVLDNADDPALIEPFLPKFPRKAQGHILLTSRKDRFRAGITGIAMPRLSEEEGIAFLFGRVDRPCIAGSDEENAAARLVEELGGLPLALEQAAAYMAAKGGGFALYLDEFRTRRTGIDPLLKDPETGFYLRYDPKTNEYAEYLTVFTTWQINFDVIEAQFPLTARLMEVLAFLAPDAIPMELIVEWLEEDKPDGIPKERFCLDTLLPAANYSLLRIEETDKTISVHRMVQAVLQDRTGEETRQDILNLIINLLNIVLTDPQVMKNWSIFARYGSQVSQVAFWIDKASIQTKAATRLLGVMAVYLRDIAAYDEAIQLNKQALAIQQSILPAGHLGIATILNNLAELYRAQDRYQEAEPLFQQALEVKYKSLPAGHPDIANSLNNLAALYYAQSRYQEAEPLYKQALAIWINSLGSKHSGTISVLGNYLNMLSQQGRTDGFAKLLEQYPALMETYRLLMQQNQAQPFAVVPKQKSSLSVRFRNLIRYFSG